MKKKWRCVCGYIHDGDEAPASCPNCGAPPEKFTALDDKAAQLVERSRHTNALHTRVISLAREIEKLCDDGLEDALDPGCVGVFTKSRDAAYVMMKLSMTEIQTHVGKGKWG